ncbi:uncharacterized protein FIESC28_04586 [Fusarium coffeatum]|uniref:Uncharacterized protein n=1 Tax=Fusarium coffeatum TaxID=231269 RepID=A0A366RYE9_9HYPO|nr:uncharacterized protein FIESC28_04586 [Fusarium coffeatum]RBR22081.1 hypothetical protein FIESC28_04586 [Fusarium coffeatum]
MTNPIDASAQHAHDSNEVTAPAKPSLRVSELGPSATREQDLANGPLLLGLGDGQDDHFAYPEMDLGSPASGIHRPEQSILPMMPPSLPRALATESLAQSTITESGASYSTPSGNLATVPIPPVLENSLIQDLIGSAIAPSWDPLPPWPRELAGPANADSIGSTVFPWSSEFSWKKSGLCFGDEPMKISRTPEDHYSKIDSGSESVLVGMGSYFEHSSPAESPGNLEAGSTICSTSSGTPSVSGITDSDTAMESFDNDPLIVMQQCVDWAVELLVDNFFRSYAPRSSKGRATGTSQTSIQAASDNRTVERPGPSREAKARYNPRKRKALGGDEGSEDEDPQRIRRTPTGSELAEDSLGWACPFVKWKPERYPCLVAPKEIRKLKGHIKNIHWNEHCDNCFITNPPAEHDSKVCIPSRPQPGFITEEMKAKIDQRESRLEPHKEQWYRIYRVLFPGEEELFETPYLDKQTKDYVLTAKEYRDSPDCDDIIEEASDELKLRGKTRERFRNSMRKSVVPKVVERMKLIDERKRLAESAQHDLQKADPTQYDLVDGSSSVETTAALNSGGQASGRSQGETITCHLFPEPEPPQASMFHAQLSVDESFVNSNGLGGCHDISDLEGSLGNLYSGFACDTSGNDFQFDGSLFELW